MAAYSTVRDGIWPKVKIIRKSMVVLVTGKNEDILTINGAQVATIITIWELFVSIKNRVLIRSGPKRSLFPTKMLLQIIFGCNRHAGCGDMHVLKCEQTHRLNFHSISSPCEPSAHLSCKIKLILFFKFTCNFRLQKNACFDNSSKTSTRMRFFKFAVVFLTYPVCSLFVPHQLGRVRLLA